MTQEDELKLLQQDELAVTVAAVTGTLFSVVSKCMARGWGQGFATSPVSRDDLFWGYFT